MLNVRCLNLTTALLCLVLSGCAFPAVALAPRVSVSAPVGRMNFEDAREVKPSSKLTPKPDAATVVGEIWVLNGHQRADHLVASVIATRFPDARIVLRECWLSQDVGMWMTTVIFRVTVDVATDGQTRTVRAEGRNLAGSLSRRNMEIAIERGLDDLAAKITAI